MLYHRLRKDKVFSVPGNKIVNYDVSCQSASLSFVAFFQIILRGAFSQFLRIRQTADLTAAPLRKRRKSAVFSAAEIPL